MALTPQPHRRADDPVTNTAVLGPIQPRNWRQWSNKFQPPTRVNAANELRPDPQNAADWHGGTKGNDVDVADGTQAIVDRVRVYPDYEPRHQEEKAGKMVPPVPLLSDLGKDYGEFADLTSRDGIIEPNNRYPSAATGETPAKFVRSNYLGPP